MLGFAHGGDVIQLLQKFLAALCFVFTFYIFVGDFCFYLK